MDKPTETGNILIDAKERQRYHGGTAPGRRSTLTQKVAPVLRHDGEALEQLAKLQHVNREYLRLASKIDAQAPELREHLVSGRLTIPQAWQIAQAPQWLRDTILARFADAGWDKRTIRAAFKSRASQ